MTGAPGPMEFILGTDDLARSIRFYDPVMAVLGLSRLPDPPKDWAGWGADGSTGLWLCKPYDGRPASHGNGTMVSFRAASAAQVRAFHATALAHGGTDEGPPGTRPAYSPDFFVAYVRDPDGHKLACADWSYDPREDT
jgi:catechol 2,3-dioxygenase-like lactoylglutathione lyase family enzyme